MTITRIGASSGYSANWEGAFGGKKKGKTQARPRAAAKRTTASKKKSGTVKKQAARAKKKS